jgi:hypothetical protein
MMRFSPLVTPVYSTGFQPVPGNSHGLKAHATGIFLDLTGRSFMGLRISSLKSPHPYADSGSVRTLLWLPIPAPPGQLLLRTLGKPDLQVRVPVRS